jgi:hypothetical protein
MDKILGSKEIRGLDALLRHRATHRGNPMNDDKRIETLTAQLDMMRQALTQVLSVIGKRLDDLETANDKAWIKARKERKAR